jgi:hypothetical protein
MPLSMGFFDRLLVLLPRIDGAAAAMRRAASLRHTSP